MRFTVGTLCARLPVACTTSALLLALGPFGAPDGILRAETRQVLAIRVEFQPDTLVTTSGDGTFGNAFRFEENWALDRLPHDRAYFEDHLAFLDHYFDTASGGRVRIEGEVWPRDGQAAYRLPKQMWQYNWNLSREKTDEQLIALFRDAWAVADADPELDFSRFDSFIVFHAGVGQDFGEDNTPHDIPSAWVSPADLEQSIDVDDGIGGPVTLIDNGLLLPESENHEGFQQGLAGTLVLQYAHVLGLPNLYNSQDGSSVIGKWGLMDQGSANYFSLVPALPSAFSRVLMGWEDPVVLARDTTNVYITPAGMAGPHPRVYKVPLSGHEHLLVEYRLRDGDGDSLVIGTDRLGNIVHMDEHYELTFPGDSTGVIVAVNDLDYDLPGSGLLVWHVDTRRTTPDYIQGNRVNDDPDPLNGYSFPGVDLEEGDGVQDIGQPYTILDSRRSVGLGSTRDPWYEGNRDWRQVNPDLGQVEYSWQGEPSSQTNDDRVSGVRLYGFNSRDASVDPDSLVFSLAWDFRPPVHGLALCPPSDSVTVQLLELADRATVLCAIHPDGDLYSLVLDGPLQDLGRSNGYRSLLPTSGSGPFRGLWAGPIDASGWPELWALRGDVFHRYHVAGSAVPEALYEQVDVYDPFMPVDRAIAVHPLLPRLWFQNDGRLYRGDTDTGERTLVMDGLAPDEILAFGDRSGTEPLAFRELLPDGATLPEGARLQGLGQPDRYLASDNSGFRIVEPGVQPWVQGYSSYRAVEWSTVTQVELPNRGVWPIQAGGDSTLEVLVLDAAGRLGIRNSLGTELELGPVVASAGTRVIPGSRRDGGIAGAVTLVEEGHLHRLDPDGTHDPEWPRVMPPFQGPLLASRRLGLYLALDTDGRVVAWEGAPEDLLVGSTAGDASGMNTVENLGAWDGQPLAAQRENPVYIWPNPTGDRASLRVTAPGPARVEMRVYDLAGDLRQTVTAQVAQPGITDIDWNTASLSNGAYLCAVELTPAQGAASRTLIKCAVLK
jgi:M6 family metalloprotease-like protein